MARGKVKTMLRLTTLALFLSALLALDASRAAGYAYNQAVYVTMRDGVRIAIDVWLPPTLSAGERVPTLMQATRYWRAYESATGDIEDDKFFDHARRINEAGYALVLVDARGSGASFGWRPYERSVEEATDYGEIVDWIVEQPWSDGGVGAYGVSYAGNTAELLLINRHPAVKAVAPLFNDFDNFSHLAFPGGALEAGPLERWASRLAYMDENDLCGYRGLMGAACTELLSRWTGVKRVDADADGSLLASAIAEHARNVNYLEAALRYEFRDDPWGDTGVTDAGRRGSPAGHLPDIEASGVPMFVRVGWQDAATVNGALGRYNTLSNVQQVTIGPWDHGARRDADPFRPAESPVSPSDDEQWAELFGFFDRYLKPGGQPIESSITYYTLGADRWTTTETWPPRGYSGRALYLGAGGELSTERPASGEAAVRYDVDFEATTGRHNRWFTNNGGGGDVVYGDRAAADERLLTFTSAPFAVDTEITGHPIITLYATSTHEDGLFIVYLEDVAPDGRVTYITEGQLRALQRKTSEYAPAYWKPGPHRSQLRADAMPLEPGQIAELQFELWATSVLIRAGHRLRVAVAGADKDTFLRYPRDGGEPTISVQTNARYASRIVLPVAD
jgi:putative CocE/NonD family hydrolase